MHWGSAALFIVYVDKKKPIRNRNLVLAQTLQITNPLVARTSERTSTIPESRSSMQEQLLCFLLNPGDLSLYIRATLTSTKFGLFCLMPEGIDWDSLAGNHYFDVLECPLPGALRRNLRVKDRFNERKAPADTYCYQLLSFHFGLED